MSFALITGGSKGIGKAMAKNLASKKYDLILVARNEAELEAAKTEIESAYLVKVLCLPLDLASDQAPKQLFDWCMSQNLNISILINNAGYGSWGFFENLPLEAQLTMMKLNMATLTSLCHLFIPILKKQSKAYILNIGSTAAYQSVPSMATYSASKSFVVVFTRALAFELAKTNISVTCYSPGATESNFTSRAGMQAMQKVADKFNMDTQVVADMGIKAMFSKKAEFVPGFVNQISVFATYILPKKLIETLAANLYFKNLPK